MLHYIGISLGVFLFSIPPHTVRNLVKFSFKNKLINFFGFFVSVRGCKSLTVHLVCIKENTRTVHIILTVCKGANSMTVRIFLIVYDSASLRHVTCFVSVWRRIQWLFTLFYSVRGSKLNDSAHIFGSVEGASL